MGLLLAWVLLMMVEPPYANLALEIEREDLLYCKLGRR